MANLQFTHIEYSITTKSLDVFNLGCDACPKCKGCFNSELWDWNLKGMSVEHTLSKLIDLNNKFDKLIDKIILVGGDPVDAYFHYPNEYINFVKEISKLNKPIYLFTRYGIMEVPSELKKLVNYVKTGSYIPELATNDNKRCGIKLATSNQTIYKIGEYNDSECPKE